MIRLIVLPLLLLGLTFISTLFFSMYKHENKQKKKIADELKEELDRKAKRELIPTKLTISDKKQLMRIFNEKIEWMIFFGEKKEYVFYYKKGEASLTGINKEYAIIEVKIKKLRFQKEGFFDISIRAWEKEEDFKAKSDPQKEMINFLCKKDLFNTQIMAAMKKFFYNKNEENHLTIETS